MSGGVSEQSPEVDDRACGKVHNDDMDVPAAARSGAGSDPRSTVVVTSIAPEVATAPGRATPFHRIDSQEPARIVLRQTGPSSFELVEGFDYDGPAGRFRVTPADLPETDLASIPQFMSWFVSRYGNHSLAALLHDHLVHNGTTLDPPVTRTQADEVFLQALTDLDVPYIRSRVMWAAVTLATRWRSSLGPRLAIGLWVVLATTGIVTLVAGLLTASPLLVAVAVLAPIPASLLWSVPQSAAGLVGGYMLWLVAVPAALNLAVYSLYSLAEKVVRRLRLLRAGEVQKSQVTPPPPYAAR